MSELLYPTFTRVVDTVRLQLIKEGREPEVWKHGARVAPMKDTLPGFFYCYTETIKGPTKAENTYIEHWCYMEVREFSDGSGRALTPIVWSVGWREWMFNFEPAICDPVAYHVNLIKERCDAIQAQRLAEHISATAERRKEGTLHVADTLAAASRGSNAC